MCKIFQILNSCVDLANFQLLCSSVALPAQLINTSFAYQDIIKNTC